MKLDKKTLIIAQTRENVESALRHLGAPSLGRPVASLPDRVIWPIPLDSPFHEWLRKAVGAGIFRGWRFFGNHRWPDSSTQPTGRWSWRQNVARFSLQIVEHSVAFEMDIDLFNPDQGAVPAFLHTLEVLRPGKTNPFRVMRGLRKRGIPVRDLREV